MMSLCRALFVVLLACLLLGCFGGKEEPPPAAAAAPPPPPPPPPPTKLELRVEAMGDVNPSSQGTGAPVVLRIYELKGLSGFNGVDFFALYDKDQASLGGDMVGKRELLIRPGEKQTLLIDPAEGTGYFGALAAFRKLDAARWRVSAPIPAHQTSIYELKLSGTQLTLTAVPVPPAQTKPAAPPAPGAPAAPPVSAPSVSAPSVPSVSAPSVPSVSAPSVPSVSTPSVPSVSAPSVPNVPSVSVPSLPSVPSVSVPSVTVPTVPAAP